MDHSGGRPDTISPALLARLREQFERLISTLLGEGLAGPAYELADTAVAAGLWPERLQRPVEMYPATARTPLFDPASFWFVSHLEQHWEPIRAELDRVADPVEAGFSSAGMDGSSVRGGAWRQVMLWDRGTRFDQACARFPVVADVVSAIPEATLGGSGFVMLSWLQPGTWIAPHCGPTNAKARAHLAVTSDPHATIRIGAEVRGWEDGRAFVFDDSYEHEVWHRGASPRVVLIVDTPNPLLVDPDSVARAERASRSDEILQYMTARHMRRITGTADGVDVEFTDEAVDFMSSYLTTREIGSAEIRNGLLRLRENGSDDAVSGR